MKAKVSNGKGSHDDDEFHFKNTSSPSIFEAEDEDVTRSKTIGYPEFNHHVRAKDVNMVIEMKFIDKKQLMEALDDYRILRGYDIEVLHSDKRRFQAKCMGSGCKSKMWASSCNNEESYQIKTISKAHSCMLFSFEKWKILISSNWFS